MRVVMGSKMVQRANSNMAARMGSKMTERTG